MSPEKGGGNEKNMRAFSKKRPTSAEWANRWFKNANITRDELTIMVENDALKELGLSLRQQEVVKMFLNPNQKLSEIAKNLIPPISESAARYYLNLAGARLGSREKRRKVQR